LPDFLIIAPPKTGSTWLAANLQCHPEIFVAKMKEVKYFSLYHRWLDLNWYAGHFREAGTRQKGEASPSYALLPGRMIRWIHSLMPHVKLVFLMREPVSRAWSHARHNYRYREANFATFKGDLEAVPEEVWRANCRHPWPLASGDYLGQLQRWRSVFPREQIHVDFYESIVMEPQALLQRVLAFLGVSTKGLDWSAFRLREIILPGVDMALPAAVARELQGLFQERTRQLEVLLRDEFHVSVREAWENTTGSDTPVALGGADPGPATEVFARAWDDEFLADLLDTEVHSSDPQLLVEGYHRYNLVLHRGRFLALAQSLGDMGPERLHEAARQGRDGPGILVGESLAHLKERVAEQTVGQLEQEVSALHTRQQHYQNLLQHYEARLSQSEAFIAELRNSLTFRAQRKLRHWLSGGTALLRTALARRPPRRAAPSAAGARLDPVLPQKPP